MRVQYGIVNGYFDNLEGEWDMLHCWRRIVVGKERVVQYIVDGGTFVDDILVVRADKGLVGILVEEALVGVVEDLIVVVAQGMELVPVVGNLVKLEGMIEVVVELVVLE